MIIDDYEVGYNIPAKIGMEVNDIQTPSLIIDYKIFQQKRRLRLLNAVQRRPPLVVHCSSQSDVPMFP